MLLVLCLALSVLPAAAADGSMPFSDVRMSDWFYREVEYVYENGLMGGTGDTTFSPNDTTSRGMIVTILHRMEGTPAAFGADFYDVAAGQYYSEAVAWASSCAIVGGYGDGRFGPNDPITREQLAAILYRYAQYKGQDMTINGSIYGFSDSWKVSTYAVDAMNWAIGRGLISGVNESSLDPAGRAVRAQTAAVLMRLQNGAPAGNETLPQEEDKDETLPEEENEVGTTGTAPMMVNGVGYNIGMSADRLPREDERLASVYGFTWYVFGTDTYQNFFAAGVDQGTVVALAASGPSFTWEGYACGEVAPESILAYGAADPNDGGILHAAMILKDGLRAQYTDADSLAGESKLNFHFVNGFRAYHGLRILQWSPAAAQAARLHSQDMADRSYFDHTNLDGVSMSQRVSAQGISWRTCGENIYAGRGSAFHTYCGWVASSGHRENILNSNFTHLGVGGGYSAGDHYGWKYTQDFFG